MLEHYGLDYNLVHEDSLMAEFEVETVVMDVELFAEQVEKEQSFLHDLDYNLAHVG